MNRNGHNGHAPAGAPTWPACPAHGAEHTKVSTKFAGWYCTGKVGRRYCDWTYTGDPPPVSETDTGLPPLSMSLSLEYKVGLPDYSSATCWLHLGGLTHATTDDEIATMVERGRLVYAAMGERIAGEAKAIRERGGW
jgi:hypothetical protein